jgi:hypothetical protein
MRTRQLKAPMRPGSRYSTDQSKADLSNVNQRWNVAARDRPMRPEVDARLFEADLGSDSQRSHERHLGLALDNGYILLARLAGKSDFQQFMQGRQPRQVKSGRPRRRRGPGTSPRFRCRPTARRDPHSASGRPRAGTAAWTASVASCATRWPRHPRLTRLEAKGSHRHRLQNIAGRRVLSGDTRRHCSARDPSTAQH